MKTTYIPQPISTEDVELSKDILELSERIAENVHEVWAASRMSEGWTYGKERNDALKQHPCLIPYDELPETEKDYDRNTAMQTLKLIQKLGYTIKKESHE
jgi:ryanodine receptor 2